MKFIVSIDDERHSKFLKRAHKAFGGPVEFNRISITPDNLPVPVPDWWQKTPKRWALVQAIRSALSIALELGEDCEVFEDDCIFIENFMERREDFFSKLPEDCDMAYLGGQLLATDICPPILIDDKIVLAKNVHRNHAWICRHRSIQRLIDWLDEPGWFNRHTCDWRIGYLHLKNDFKVYIPKRDGYAVKEKTAHN